MFEIIKQLTRENHGTLEKFFLSEIRKFREVRHYSEFLSLMYSYHLPLENAIAAFMTQELMDALGERRNAQWLLYDLEALGVAEDPSNRATITHVNCLSSALGALYVLEGSTHGGPYIAKMIRSALSIEEPFRYFNGYGDMTSDKWEHFKRSLSVFSDRIDTDKMTDGANQTFLSLQRWMEESKQTNGKN